MSFHKAFRGPFSTHPIAICCTPRILKGRVFAAVENATRDTALRAKAEKRDENIVGGSKSVGCYWIEGNRYECVICCEICLSTLWSLSSSSASNLHQKLRTPSEAHPFPVLVRFGRLQRSGARDGARVVKSSVGRRTHSWSAHAMQLIRYTWKNNSPFKTSIHALSFSTKKMMIGGGVAIIQVMDPLVPAVDSIHCTPRIVG